MRTFPATTGLWMLLGCAGLFAQTSAPPSPVVGVGTFIHVVADLDKTMRFYGDLLGLERTGAPGPRAFATNAVVEGLYDAKGSESRVAAFKIPGSPMGLEFVEFKGVSQRPFRAGPGDAGASIVSIPVRDLDSVNAKLSRDTVTNRGGIVQDPDGFFIKLVDGGSPASLRLIVDNTGRTVQMFRELLGFQPLAFGDGPSVMDTAKMDTAKMDTAKIPGTDFIVRFDSSGKGPAPASTHDPAIHDPGAGVLRLIVRDVDALLETLKAAGVPVASAGGEPVKVGGRNFVIMRDPDGFFFQLAPQPVR